jgi:hypothetical protein
MHGRVRNAATAVPRSARQDRPARRASRVSAGSGAIVDLSPCARGVHRVAGKQCNHHERQAERAVQCPGVVVAGDVEAKTMVRNVKGDSEESDERAAKSPGRSGFPRRLGSEVSSPRQLPRLRLLSTFLPCRTVRDSFWHRTNCHPRTAWSSAPACRSRRAPNLQPSSISQSAIGADHKGQQRQSIMVPPFRAR